MSKSKKGKSVADKRHTKELKRKKRKHSPAKKEEAEASSAGGTLSGIRRGMRNMASGGEASDPTLSYIFWVALAVAVAVFALGFVRC